MPRAPKTVALVVPTHPNGDGAPCPGCAGRDKEIERLQRVIADAKAEMQKVSDGEKLDEMIEREIRSQLIAIRCAGGEYENVNAAKIIETAVKFLAVKNRVPMPGATFGSALMPRQGE